MENWRGRNAAEWVGALGNSAPEAGEPGTNAETVLQLANEIRLQHADHRRRVRWRRAVRATAVGLGVTAAAAVGLVVARRGTAPPLPVALVQVRAFEREVTLDSGSSREPLSVGRELDAGQTIATGSDARAVLAIVAGGSLSVGAFSDLVLMASEGKRELGGVRLRRGRVEVDLPKLAQGRTFDVTTPDAKVMVVGTKFEVRVLEGVEGPRTCVSVTRGMVRVVAADRAALLSAGQHWTSRGQLAECESPSPVNASKLSSEIQQAKPAPAVSVPSPLRRLAPGSSATATGTLAEENRLFLELVRARREGRNGEASALQRRFLARYPSSVLSSQVLEEQRRTER